MARFPQIIDYTTAASTTTDATTHTITFPVTSIEAGDLVLIFYSTDGNETCTVSTGSNWNKLGDAVSGTACTASVFWKVYTSAGPETVVITTTTEQSSCATFIIRGFDPNIAAPVIGNSTNNTTANVNPPSLSLPSYGDQDYLFFVYYGNDSTGVASGAPSNFTNLTTRAASGTEGASTNIATREYRTSGSYDPGSFTSSAIAHGVWTIAICPILGHSTNRALPCLISVNQAG